MPKPSFEAELAKLRAIARGEITGEAIECLRSTLRGSQATLAALAAQIIAHRRIADLEQELVKAFDRFITGTDKGCQAKTAIVVALQKLNHLDDEVYLRGIRHVQMEPVYGGQADMAADLRAECAVALANMRHPNAGFELTNLLVDPEVNPRRAAVKALTHLGTEGAVMVIRLKALTGDPEPEILGECFSALMALSPTASMSFVGRFLDSPNLALAEQAAMVLGQSHEAEAFRMLSEAWDNNVNPGFRRMLLLPISLLRRDEAFEFLLGIVENGNTRLAEAALSVLGVYADEKGRHRIRDAVNMRGDSAVSDTFKREFGGMD